MKAVFSLILNMSLTGSAVIGAVLGIRLLLKRSPKIYSYILWSVVLFRLLCPVSLSAPVSLLNWLQPEVTATSQRMNTVSYVPYAAENDTETPAANAPVSEQPGAQEQPAKTDSAKPDVLLIGSRVWVVGCCAMVTVGAVQYMRLKKRLVVCTPLKRNVYLADDIDTPFVMGILRPRIYLPTTIRTEERRYILAHERHHIRRGDHIIKMLAYLALCIHWFNPLVWLAFACAGKDMEMSCDEAVIQQLGAGIRADYSATLLRMAKHRYPFAGTPLAFGEGDTKGRVLNMAKWKKPKLWVSAICVVLCAGVLAACALNPEKVGSIGDPNSDGPTATFTTSNEGNATLENTRMDGPVSSGLEDFKFTLPEGMSLQFLDNGYGFYAGDIEAGGLALRYQPQANDPDAFSQEWQVQIGVPEASDKTLGYMGSGSNYADYEITYFPDIPVNYDEHGRIIQDENGKRVTENEVTHYFFLNGTDVYDLWFYSNRFPLTLKEKLLKSCYIEGVTDTEAMEAAAVTEEESLAKCREVLEAVQSGSCQIAVTDSRGNSRWSTANYYQSNENWLKVIDVDPESVNIVDGEQYSLRMAYMAANGGRYSNEGNWGKAYTDIVWRADDQTFDDGVKPWLASFQWNDAVAYMDTLTDDNGMCVMLRVDQKYKDPGDYDPHYFVDFNFDQAGSFVNVTLQVNLFREDDLTVKESIVSLDQGSIPAEIDKEYQRAIE